MKKFANILVKAIAQVIRDLPVQLQFLMGDFLGWLWFDLLRVRREIVIENIRLAYPELSKQEVTTLARESMYNLCRGFIEFMQIPALSKESWSDRELFTIKGQEHLAQAKSQGKGVCLLSQHIGNGDWATAGLALNDIPITLISKVFKIKWLNDFWFGIRGKLGTKFIPPRNSSMAILKALKAKENVVFVMDQFMGPPIGVKTLFFGRETGTAMGLSVMVARSKSPVIPVWTYRQADGHSIVEFGAEIPFEEKSTQQETIAHMTQVYTNHIEKLVRKIPQQWMWVHRRWKVFKH